MARDGGGEAAGAGAGVGIDFLSYESYYLLAFSLTTFAKRAKRPPTHARDFTPT